MEKLEARLAGIPIPPTLEEQARQDSRRLPLCRAALDGEYPEDLDEGEQELFEKIRKSAPIFQELISEGIIAPAGANPDDDLEPLWLE